VVSDNKLSYSTPVSNNHPLSVIDITWNDINMELVFSTLRRSYLMTWSRRTICIATTQADTQIMPAITHSMSYSLSPYCCRIITSRIDYKVTFYNTTATRLSKSQHRIFWHQKIQYVLPHCKNIRCTYQLHRILNISSMLMSSPRRQKWHILLMLISLGHVLAATCHLPCISSHFYAQIETTAAEVHSSCLAGMWE